MGSGFRAQGVLGLVVQERALFHARCWNPRNLSSSHDMASWRLRSWNPALGPSIFTKS